jgi:hypothetical protein
MTRLTLAAFCLAILTFAGCSQPTTDPAKAAVPKPGTVQSQSPASNAPSDRGGGGDGGGGGY